MKDDNPAYGFQLADGSRWELRGDAPVARWLAELYRILACKPLEGKATHVIHFHGVGELSGFFNETPRFSNSSAKGWESFKNGTIHRIWRHPDIPEIHVTLHEAFLDHKEIRYINMWSALREIHRYALSRGGTPIHAALGALHGKGFLIAAEGGVGKSTCHGRLRDPWEKLCDDQALILPEKGGKFMVHPLPTWSDHLWRKSRRQWNVERFVPLRAVFFLEQAQTDEAVPLKDPAEAVIKTFKAAKEVWEPAWSKLAGEEKAAQASRLFDNVSRLVRTVQAYRLRATLEGKFWDPLEKVLTAVPV